ncbi:MAG TPA: superoxide dismutase, Ni [Tepidiformaceae bacterium]|nr:superoxide dismutase, Ni [Thermoflexaceae bacterium]HMS57889.1 superoxide dismutase, Ni [Tepidiformaceae bacterium]
MNLFRNVFRPGATAHAHCDGPCGVYDPASARIAAEAVLSMEKKIAALGDGQDIATVNTRTRFIGIKEQQAEVCKRELDILWHDYFKPEHLEKYPNLHETFWKAAKLCSKNKTEQDPANGEALLQAVEEIHTMYWGSKGKDVPFIRAS